MRLPQQRQDRFIGLIGNVDYAAQGETPVEHIFRKVARIPQSVTELFDTPARPRRQEKVTSHASLTQACGCHRHWKAAIFAQGDIGKLSMRYQFDVNTLVALRFAQHEFHDRTLHLPTLKLS